MNMLNRFHQCVMLIVGSLLLSSSLAVQAEDIQDANKLFKQGQYKQALSKVNGVLASKPKDAQARFLKGLIFTEQGEITDSINIFSALTEDYPELPEPYNNLAVLYAGLGQYDNAKLALEMAIRTHPSYATAHENLGDIYAKMASQAYDRALQLDRSNTATQTKLAMIQELFGGSARGKETAAHGSGKNAGASPVMLAENKPQSTIASSAADAPAAMSDTGNEVLDTVRAWAAAWSSQDANRYLAFYADDYKTPSGEPRAAWEAARRERLSAPKSIQVDIGNATVTFSDNDHASVKFRQSYRANHLKTSGKKTLLMVKTDGKWLIREERAN